MALWNLRLPVLALSAAVLCGSSAFAAEPKTSPKEIASFGTLTAPTEDVAKAKTVAWLKSVGKDDADTMKQVDAIWASDRVLLDKVADTLCLGNADAAKLMAEARDVNAPAPVETPAVLKDTKQPVFFLRGNLTLAYAKALSTRHVYEEALEALLLVKGEQVIDPSSYFFHRSVAEFSLMLRRQADESITRLLEDCGDAPDRYKMVAALMHFDMLTWQDKDLGWIARKMDNIQRRLDLNRGGQQTQKMQREVLVRLDEMIKEKENQQKQQGQGQGKGEGNGGNCPGGGDGPPGPPNGNKPNSQGAKDFGLPSGNEAGLVDPQRVGELAKNWGTLPEKERAKAMLELTRGLDPKYREAIEMYVKEMARKSAEGRQK